MHRGVPAPGPPRRGGSPDLGSGGRPAVAERVAESEIGRREGIGISRAAGHACATNPIPIVLPCHRVVRSDGDLNWYTGGLRYKELLLSVEGVPLTRRGDRPRVAAKET